MAATITEDGGVITITGDLGVRNDTFVETDITVTENLLVSGNLLIEDTIGEVADSVKYYALDILNVPMYNTNHCYTLTPVTTDIVGACITLTEVLDDNFAIVSLDYGGIDPVVLGSAFYSYDPIGKCIYDNSIVGPTSLSAGIPLFVYTGGGATTTGLVNVTLICRQT